MSDDHESLVSRALSGDDVAVETLLRRHLGGLRAFIRLRSSRVVREKESCSDIAQSVCREVLENAERFDYRGEAAFRAWLFDKALSKIHDRLRYYKAQKRDVAREVGEPADDLGYAGSYATIVTPSREAMGHEALGLVEQAFDELPDEQREVVTLARIVGLSRKEIAERLGRSEGSVRGLLERGLTRLSWILSRHMPDD